MKVELFAPAGYKGSEWAEKGKCGPGVDTVGDKLVPEKILGLVVTEACKIHDYMYAMGETNDDKDTADRVFKHNLFRLIDARGGWLRLPRKSLAYIYYLSVSVCGGPAYWSNKNTKDEVVEVTI